MTFLPSWTVRTKKYRGQQEKIKQSRPRTAVSSLRILTIVDELVELNEVVSVVVDVDGLSVVVEFRSEVNADDGVGVGLLGLDLDLVVVLLVVQTVKSCLDRGVSLFLGLGLNDAVLEVDEVLVEVGNEVGEDNVLDLYAGEDEVIVLVGRQRLLVAVEELDDALVELVEGRVADSGLAEFEGRRGVAPDVDEFGGVAEKLSGDGLKTAVVSGVDASAGSFDEVTEDVETLGLVEREELLLGRDDVAGVDGVEQSLLEGVDVLDELVVVGVGEVKLVGTAGEFEAVGVTEMRLVRSLNVLEVDFLDGSETVAETLKVVVSEELLVKVVVTGTTADVVFALVFVALLVSSGLLDMLQTVQSTGLKIVGKLFFRFL